MHLAAQVYRKDKSLCPLYLGATVGLSPQSSNCLTSAALHKEVGAVRHEDRQGVVAVNRLGSSSK